MGRPSQSSGEDPGEENGLTILIPVFNEEEAVKDVLDSVGVVRSALSGFVEVLVVDDGSQDRTAAVLKDCGGIRLIRHGSNRGYGSALKTGIRQAMTELIVIMDADGTYAAQEIPKLVAAYDSADVDMIIGARVDTGAAIPLFRRPAKWMINRLASFVAGEQIPDVNSGMRVFRRQDALQYFDLLPDGFSFTTTFTLAMIKNGYIVGYEPIGYAERTGSSKIRPLADTMGFLQLILRIALYFAPLKIFFPLSGILLLLAGGWAALTWLAFGRVADASTAVIAMGAVQIAVVGLLAELINSRMPNRHDRRSRPQ